MATLSFPPIVESGVAAYALPGQKESGDRHIVRHWPGVVLIAAIDGLGHGDEAALAAKRALSILMKANAQDSVIALLERCHEGLRSTRGVVMSVASIDSAQGLMTWIGVGNVQGVIVRRNATPGPAQQELLLRAGVVGAQLPPLQGAVLPIARGDTLVFVTDGIRSGFADKLSALEPPQKSADRILAEYCRGSDDALVVVTRYLEDQK